ncbi:Hydin [Symbiodinium sp. CCMP2592]|nr:Hydin [Symbiodinium sp. CCMP2592]
MKHNSRPLPAMDVEPWMHQLLQPVAIDIQKIQQKAQAANIAADALEPWMYGVFLRFDWQRKQKIDDRPPWSRLDVEVASFRDALEEAEPWMFPYFRSIRLGGPGVTTPAKSEVQVPVTALDFMPTSLPIRMDYDTAVSSLQMHSHVVNAIRRGLAAQVQVPLETISVTLQPGPMLAHAQIDADSMEAASVVAKRATSRGGKSLVGQVNVNLAEVPGVSNAVGQGILRVKVFSATTAACDRYERPPRRKSPERKGRRGRSSTDRMTLNSACEAVMAWGRANGLIPAQSPKKAGIGRSYATLVVIVFVCQVLSILDRERVAYEAVRADTSTEWRDERLVQIASFHAALTCGIKDSVPEAGQAGPDEAAKEETYLTATRKIVTSLRSYSDRVIDKHELTCCLRHRKHEDDDFEDWMFQFIQARFGRFRVQSAGKSSIWRYAFLIVPDTSRPSSCGEARAVASVSAKGRGLCHLRPSRLSMPNSTMWGLRHLPDREVPLLAGELQELRCHHEAVARLDGVSTFGFTEEGLRFDAGITPDGDVQEAEGEEPAPVSEPAEGAAREVQPRRGSLSSKPFEDCTSAQLANLSGERCTVAAGSTPEFQIEFAPKEVDDFVGILDGRMPIQDPMRIRLQASALRPWWRFEVLSDCRSRRQAETPPDPKCQVIEFESLGTRVRNTKRFYELHWVPEESDNREAEDSFCYFTKRGIIRKTYEMLFKYLPAEDHKMDGFRWLFSRRTVKDPLMGPLGLERNCIKFIRFRLGGKTMEKVCVVNKLQA